MTNKNSQLSTLNPDLPARPLDLGMLAGVGAQPPIPLRPKMGGISPAPGAGPQPECPVRAVTLWLGTLRQLRSADRRQYAELIWGELQRWIAHESLGYSRVLRGAVALALTLREKIYADLVDAAGTQLYRDENDFVSAFLREAGLGESPARLTRLRRGGDLWLGLYEAARPLPASLGRLEPLLALPLDAALQLYTELSLQAGGGVPPYALIVGAMAQMHRPRPVTSRPRANAASWARQAVQITRQLTRALAAERPDPAVLRQQLDQLVQVLRPAAPRSASRPAAADPRLASLAMRPCGNELTLCLAALNEPATRHYVVTAALQRGWQADATGLLRFPLTGNDSKKWATKHGEQSWLRRLCAPAARSETSSTPQNHAA
jgi:hypothetical protein